MDQFNLWRSTVIAALVALASPAWAEKLEFRQCVERALAQNPDLAISRSQIEQAEAAVRQAEGNKLPRLNLSLTASRSNDPLNAFGMKLGQSNVSFGDFGPPAGGPFGNYPANLSTLNNPDAVNKDDVAFLEDVGGGAEANAA